MSDPDSALARLQRWEASGGHWRVLPGRRGQVVVALERCDGGEEIDRLVSDDPDLRDYLAGRTTP